MRHYVDDLGLPAGVVVKGRLPATQSPDFLVGDMLEIDLPDGTTIDVGWVPEHEESGRYRIVVYRDYWNNWVEEPIYTRDLDFVVRMLRNIAKERSCNRVVWVSDSSNSVALTVSLFGAKHKQNKTCYA